MPASLSNLTMTEKEYRQHPAISNSDLTLINKSVEHYQYNKLNPKAPTPAMKFGTAFHCYVLEPQKFKKTYVTLPAGIKPGSSNAYKDFRAAVESSGQEIIADDDLEAITIMADKVSKLKLLTGGKAETPYFGKIRAAETDIDVKCRPDYITESRIFDLKSTTSADAEDFDSSIRNYRYYVQAAFYLEICRQHNPLIESFVFIAVESSAPYGIACYELDAGYLAAGKIQFIKDLEKYIYDTRTNRTGYATGVNIIQPPDWFMRHYTQK